MLADYLSEDSLCACLDDLFHGCFSPFPRFLSLDALHTSHTVLADTRDTERNKCSRKCCILGKTESNLPFNMKCSGREPIGNEVTEGTDVNTYLFQQGAEVHSWKATTNSTTSVLGRAARGWSFARHLRVGSRVVPDLAECAVHLL